MSAENWSQIVLFPEERFIESFSLVWQIGIADWQLVCPNALPPPKDIASTSINKIKNCIGFAAICTMGISVPLV